MRITRTGSFVMLAFALVFGQAPQRGVFVQDIDRKADPCTDFYEYANGAWRAANPIPAYIERWSRRWAAGDQAKEQLRIILDEISQKTDWPQGSVEQLVGDHYAACRDEKRINELGARPLQPLLRAIDGMKTRDDLSRMILRLHDIAVGVPFGLYGESDNHDPEQVIAYVGARGLGLPDRDYYFKSEPRFQEARAKYRSHLSNMFRLIGYDAARAKAAADTVFAMETRLAGASLDNVALRDPYATDHKMSFAELQKLAPHFDWTAYFDGAKVPKSALNVNQPKFLREVERQLTQTPLADWKTYLTWHLVRSAAPWLSQPFVEESFDFRERFLSGATEMKPRWKRCVESTDALLGEALGRKYVERYFPPAAKQRMEELVKNLQLAMRETIGELEWMGPETKKRALEKLSTFNPKIGYPDKWKDYSQVVIRREGFWEDVVAGHQFDVEDDRATIGKPVDRGRWGMTPPTSNAYYNPSLNEIVFPAGILQPPAFSMETTDAVNYGAIGVVIGHEISHGYDDQGAQFDAQGRLRNWWTDEDLKKFRQRTACVVEQFENYYIEPGIHHNGRLVLGEAIGDLAGAKIAYRAYQISRRGKGPEPVVAGFTPEQQFFIAWGQFRGDAIRPEEQRQMIQGDPHPVAKYRVIGPLSNIPAFHQAFGCREGAPMVRRGAKRCELW